MSKPSYNAVLNKERDYSILAFLWKWKVATSATLAAKFFPNAKPKTSYERIRQLIKAKYIQWQLNQAGHTAVLTLTKKGFQAIRGYLPPLKEEGFGSENVRHDLYSLAIHLGDWLKEKPTHVKLFSEQQLRRYAKESYFDWVPDGDIHRPDGYWKIDQPQTKIIALEVELSQKRTGDYEQLARFYSYYKKINSVLWLVSNVRFAKFILEKISSIQNSNYRVHNFVILPQFEKLGWDAPIEIGNQGYSTITHLLMEKPRKRAGNFLEPAFFDTRKTPYGSRSLRDQSTLKISD